MFVFTSPYTDVVIISLCTEDKTETSSIFSRKTVSKGVKGFYILFHGEQILKM